MCQKFMQIIHRFINILPLFSFLWCLRDTYLMEHVLLGKLFSRLPSCVTVLWLLRSNENESFFGANKPLTHTHSHTLFTHRGQSKWRVMWRDKMPSFLGSCNFTRTSTETSHQALKTGFYWSPLYVYIFFLTNKHLASESQNRPQIYLHVWILVRISNCVAASRAKT